MRAAQRRAVDWAARHVASGGDRREWACWLASILDVSTPEQAMPALDAATAAARISA